MAGRFIKTFYTITIIIINQSYYNYNDSNVIIDSNCINW